MPRTPSRSAGRAAGPRHACASPGRAQSSQRSKLVFEVEHLVEDDEVPTVDEELRHLRLSAPVLVQPVRLDLEGETDPTHATNPLRPLEVELLDVAGVERERVAEQHGAVLADGELAELAGLELVAFLALDDAGGERGARV